MVKAAFIGLGVMGYPMARHLKAKGHDVTVYNRTAAKAEKWVSENGGASAPTPRDANPELPAPLRQRHRHERVEPRRRERHRKQ